MPGNPPGKFEFRDQFQWGGPTFVLPIDMVGSLHWYQLRALLLSGNLN